MEPVQHKSNTIRLLPPKDWDKNGPTCDILPVTETLRHNLPALKSYWQPNEIEIANILAGGLIVLTVIGKGMPPIQLSVEPL